MTKTEKKRKVSFVFSPMTLVIGFVIMMVVISVAISVPFATMGTNNNVAVSVEETESASGVGSVQSETTGMNDNGTDSTVSLSLNSTNTSTGEYTTGISTERSSLNETQTSPTSVSSKNTISADAHTASIGISSTMTSRNNPSNSTEFYSTQQLGTTTIGASADNAANFSSLKGKYHVPALEFRGKKISKKREAIAPNLKYILLNPHCAVMFLLILISLVSVPPIVRTFTLSNENYFIKINDTKDTYINDMQQQKVKCAENSETKEPLTYLDKELFDKCRAYVTGWLLIGLESDGKNFHWIDRFNTPILYTCPFWTTNKPDYRDWMGNGVFIEVNGFDDHPDGNRFACMQLKWKRLSASVTIESNEKMNHDQVRNLVNHVHQMDKKIIMNEPNCYDKNFTLDGTMMVIN
ncbi:hypothetical protein SNEBB_006958 [Seison nebaliae]|nr:hypothetical protein SNEBB_006958 [Seison nebaliae]